MKRDIEIKAGLLVLNPNNGKTQRHACLKVWQKGTMVGVRFLV